jgi:hypothetical protein
MRWSDKLQEWKAGVPQTYPPRMHGRFLYETAPVDRRFNRVFKEKFILSTKLDHFGQKQDFTAFKDNLRQTKNKNVGAWLNLSGDAVLIVPVPKKGKNFATMKDFIDNATLTQQKAFWKRVAAEIETVFKTTTLEKVYLNAHGLGVPYFHLRLDTRPKYYTTAAFKV